MESTSQTTTIIQTDARIAEQEMKKEDRNSIIKMKQCDQQTLNGYTNSNGCILTLEERNGHINEKNSIKQGIYLAQIDGCDPSPRMKELLEGVNVPGDCGNPAEPPPWLDRHLFERGRQFYNRFLLCIFFSDLLALVLLFSVNRILRPLIYTGKSDTPWKALRRYVSTITHVIQWYSGDVWNKEDEAHKDVLRVRSIHMKYANMFNSTMHHSRVDEVSVYTKGHAEPKCPFSSELQRDLQCQVMPGYSLQDSSSPTLYVSQWDMAITQYSFMGLIIRHPRKLGVWWATDEDLEGFIHFWRGLGWLLGIDDHFNFCNGSLEETRVLCLEMEHRVMSPNMAAGDWSYEHMCNSLLSGMRELIPGLEFPGMVRFLGDLLGFRVPAMTRRMSYKETFRYWFLRFFLQVVFIIPGVVSIFNGLLKVVLDISTGQQPPLWLRWLPKSSLPPVVKPHKYS